MARTTKKEKMLTTEEKLAQALVPESEQPYKVPKNWCWVYSHRIFDVQYGKGLSTKDLTEDGYPVFGANGQIGFYCEYMFEQPQALMSCRGAYSGVMNITVPKSYVTSNSLIIQSRNVKLDPRYICYLFESQDKRKIVSGTAQPQVTVQAFRHYPVPMVPLAEQQRIVDRIESLFAKLDEAKEKAQSVVDGFENRKAAILHKAFTGELIGIKRGNTVPLNAIVETIRIGPFGSALHKEDYVLGGIPVVNPKHIVAQQIIHEDKVAITEEKATELEGYRLKTGDIIMGRRGEMGRSAPVTCKENGWLCGTGSLIIRLKDGYDAAFYSQIIASHSSVRYLEENCVGSTMKNLNEKVIKSLPVPKYSKEEQKTIAIILSNLFKKEQQVKEAAEQVIEKIDIMKKSILARAFRGELGTNAPNDEPAEELLKRVL